MPWKVSPTDPTAEPYWEADPVTTTPATTSPATTSPATSNTSYNAADYPNYTATPFDQYTMSGLGNAQTQISQNQSQGFQYPSYTPSQQNAPTQQAYYNYTPTAPLAQVQAPNYSGLMGGDYNALQSALQQPGQTAATTAYNQGYNNLNNTMGGKGLYGSSIMANQANQGLDTTYQNTLSTNAANAAAQRYQLEQAGLIDMNKYNLQNTQLQQTQNAADWQARNTSATQQMNYDEGKMNWNQSYADQMTKWQNQQQYEQYAYNLAKTQAQSAYGESMVNQNLALAGSGATLSGQAQQAATSAASLAAQQQIAANNASVASQSGWLGAGTTLAGGLLGAYTSSNNTDALVKALGG